MSRFVSQPRALREATLVLLLLCTPTAARAQSATPAAPGVPRSFASLFTGAAHNLGRLGAEQPLFILGLGGALAGFSSTVDKHLTMQLTNSAAMDTAFEAGDLTGNGFVQVGAAVTTWVVGGLAHKPGVVAIGADLIQAQMVAGVLTQSLKFAIPRKRPDGSGKSFPSGHAAASFTTADVLKRHYGWKVGIPAYATAAYIGASRLSENRHYISDVVFGAAIGIASSRTLVVGKSRRVTAVPVATRGGAAVLFTVHPQMH